MPDSLNPSSGALSDTRKRLTPELHDAFQTFSRKVFANGALATKTKQLIAVAVAHVTQCPYCIRGHTKAAMREGATSEELMEAISSRDARRCRVRALGPGLGRNGKGCPVECRQQVIHLRTTERLLAAKRDGSGNLFAQASI